MENRIISSLILHLVQLLTSGVMGEDCITQTVP